MKPKVSIVIPVYNGSNYMREAIDSALNQTYDNCEVIVVNDGSDDQGKTEMIAKEYGNRIKYLQKENGGVATAVNLGIKYMTGEYFSWLSHDDIFYPQKIELQINALKKDGDMKSIVHGNFDFLCMDTGRTQSIDWLQRYTVKQLENSNFAPVFLCIHGSCILIHRSHFDRVGLYNEKLLSTQDSEFLFRVMRGQHSVFVPKKLIIGRLHKEQGQKTMKVHSEEYNDMFVSFCETLADEEKIAMCGSVLNFYYRLYTLLKYSSPANYILKYLKEKIYQENIKFKEHGFEIEKLRAVLYGIENHIKKIYLFGAGQYGKELLIDLSQRDIEICGFIDNNENKQGVLIEGIKCCSIQEVLEYKEESLFIIAMLDGASVLKQLKQEGIHNILLYNDVQKYLFKYVPSRFYF